MTHRKKTKATKPNKSKLDKTRLDKSCSLDVDSLEEITKEICDDIAKIFHKCIKDLANNMYPTKINVSVHPITTKGVRK